MSGAERARAIPLGSAGGAALVLWLLCCTEPADVPDTPDLSGLAAAYDDPTGTLLDEAEVEALIERYPELRQLAEAFRLTRSLVARADEGREAADDRDGRGIQLRGGVEVTLDCPGDGTGSDPGTLSVQLAVSHSRIHRSFWARARECRFLAQVAGNEVPIELDGDFAVDVGSDIPLGGTWPTSPMLVALPGTMTLNGVEFSDVSARVDDESFEYLQPVSDGNVVLFVTDSGIGLRDARATWYCETDDGACTLD